MTISSLESGVFILPERAPTVRRPSAVDAFTNSAFNAMSVSNPTHPLPPEYPEESVVFTVTFYFNETPPSRFPRSR